MPPWTWYAIGAGLLALILALSVRLNRSKTTADLALRLAEAYRLHGRFEAAERLYRVPGELDQNRPEAEQGLRLCEQGKRLPALLDRPLVEAGEEALRGDRAMLVEVLARRGVQVELPPLEGGG